MNRDDEQCLKLGREVVRMIHEVRALRTADTRYARRTFTFPGGEVVLLIAGDSQLADVMEAGVKQKYDVVDIQQRRRLE